MHSCSYHSVMRQAAGLAGFTMSQLSSTPRAMLQAFIQRRLKLAWEGWWWPEIMHAEERAYADDWSAQDYPADAVVYHGSGYWTCPNGALAVDEPGVAAAWEGVTEISPPTIALEQAGKIPIGTVRMVTVDNPDVQERPRPTRFRLGSSGIVILGEDAPATIYVWYRERVPTYLGEDISNETDYSEGEQVYFEGDGPDYEGDFWIAGAPTVPAGQTPQTNPELWTKVAFPAWLREYVAHGAYADWLRQDGNPEAAALAESEALVLLNHEKQVAGPMQRQVLYSRGA